MKITTEYLRYAPKSMSWCAIDVDSYDGAPDASGPSQCVGQGSTQLEAISDLVKQLEQYRDEKHPVALAEAW